MSQVLTLKFSQGASVGNGKELETAIKLIPGIKSAGVQQTRGLDAAVVASIWIGVANPAMDVIKKIIELIRGKGLTGVEIQVPHDGGTLVVKADSASPADLERLLKAVRGDS